MKNLITYLKTLWSLSRADRVRTLAIDAVSLPSFCRVNMLKLVSVLVILLTIGSGNAWGAEGANHDFSQTISHSLNYGYEPNDITIAEQSYTIKEVIITYSSNKSSKFSASVSVNGNDWGTKSWTKTTNTTTYTTISYKTSPQTSTKGAVTISFTNTAGSSETGQGTLSITNVRLVEGASAAPAYTITAQSNNNSYGTVSLSGTTITATPNSGYRVMSGTDGYTVTSGSATVVNNGDNTFTVTPSSNCTVQINFESKGCTDHAGTNVVSGASTSYNYGPVNPYYEYSTREILYTKTDLGLVAGKKGTIKSIYFQYANASAMTGTNSVKIYMANTNLSALSTSNYLTSFTEVYSGALNCKDGWNEITLTTPFDYNGIGNLVVVIDDNSNKDEGSSAVFKYHEANTTTGAQLYTQSSSTNADPTAVATWTGANETNNRPNTKFCIQEADMTPATVTLMDNGATITEVSAGAGVTLPSRAGCTGYTFAGWTKTWVAPQSSWTTTAPTIIPAGSYTPSANENLYPVYTKTEGGGSPEFSQYQQVALGGTITAGKYLISTGSYTMAGNGKTGVSLTPGTTEAAAREYTVAIVSGTTITIKGPDNKYIGGLDKADGLTFSTTTPSSDDYRWVYTENGIQNKSITGRHIKAYSTTDFRHYGTGNGTLTYFYKRIETSGSTTSYISVPNCCTDPGLNYGTGSVTKTYGASAFTNTLTNSHSVAVTYASSDPTVATVNGSGQVTILKAGSTTITASSVAQTVSTVDYCADEASYTLNVSKADISPTLTYDPAAVTVGSTLTSFTLSGNSGSGTVTYVSSNDAIATVNSSGVVTGVAPGTVTITATIAATTNYNGNTATSNTITVNAAACTGVNSLHTGNKDQGGWVTNQCFEDADWGAADDAIYVGAFPLTNECYVGWAGGNSYHGTYWAVGGIKTYDIPTGRTLGWNSGNYYESYPGGALGTFHIYKNSTDENYYLRFKPSSYILRTGSDGTSWTSREMTVSATNSHYYETAELDLTSTLISEHAYVDLKTNGGDGHVWCNFSNDRTASGNVKVKSSVGDADGNFRGDNLKASDNGTHGKFRIDVTKDVDNWKLAFVPMYRITYAPGTGASGSMDPSSYAEISTTIAAAAEGFTDPTGKQFNGWSDGVNSYAAGANVTMNSNVTLTAQWTDIDYTVTVSQSPDVSATTTGQTSSAHYNGTINLTVTDIPSGYRFVNWTTSDGFSITNSTSATTASFTMPAKNVTVTANFQQTHTVDWYVGGSAPANKIGDDGQTTVVDHGGKISDFPATTPDGSACDKVFVGWTNTSSYVHGTSPLFNDVAGSPTINADAQFYAVFATGGSTTVYLTESEISTSFVSGTTTSYGNYTITSASGTWGGKITINKVTISATDVYCVGIRKHADNNSLGSPTFSGNISNITVTGRHNAGSARDIYICSSNATAQPTSGDIGSGSIPAGPGSSVYTDWTDVSITPTGDHTSFYIYANGGLQIKTVAVTYGGYSGYTITCADCGTSVTPTYTAAPTGGTVSVTKNAAAVASGSTVKTCTSQDLTVTLTPATHYDLTGFTATGLSTGTATISPAVNTVVPTTSEQTFTVTVSAGATGTLNLTPTFTPETPLTITLSTNSKGTFTNPDPWPIYSGESFTFPDVTPNDPSCATFVGWIEGTTFVGDGTTHDAPVTIAAGSSSGAQSSNTTYTAVFYETETSESDAYVKVTAAPEPPATWANDHYLIVYEDAGNSYTNAVAFAGSRDNGDNGNIDATSNGIAVTIVGGNTIAATSSLAANEWRIAAVTGGYSIQSASGYYIGRAANSNGIDASNSTAYVNTIGYSDSRTNITSAGGKILKYNTAGDQLRFRYLTSAGDIQLYKLGTAVVETRTYTTNPSCTPKYRVTVASVTGGSPSADPKFNPESTTVTITANPSAGYSFTSWTITKTTGGDNVTSTLLTGDKPTTANTTFTMPAYDITIAATYAKKMVTELKVMDDETVVANTTGPVSGTLNVSTGANKTLDVVITPSDAFDHSWTATVSAGSTYASITNVTAEGFRVNGVAQGDATITVTASNDEANGGTPKVVTFTVHVTDILPEEIILKRDGSNTPIETLIMYYDASESKGQYMKVNVSYSPSNPTNKAFTFSSAATGKVGSHSHSNNNGYEVLVANGVTTDPVNCTFTSSANGSVTKVLAVTVLPILTDRFVDYVHGNATQTVSARLSADRYTMITDINTPSLSDASDANPTSEDCETAHYHLIGWLPQATAEALWAAGTPITEATEGLVKAGVQVEATGQTWYAIWGKEE